MNALVLSDMLISFIHSPQVSRRFRDVNLVIGCGDLPYYYLEYVVDLLDIPLFFVRGNHDKVVEYGVVGERYAPGGGENLHRKNVRHGDLLLAGVEGCLRYRPGPFQYTQSQMWRNVLGLVPGLIYNKGRFGRYLDVFVTHAPPQGIHDKADLTHQGIDAFRWLDRVFQPKYHFHGHIHVYNPDEITETIFGRTRVVNAYGFREIDLTTSRSITVDDSILDKSVSK
jgi:Icc-related predicted phosphoesterase